MGEQDAGEAGCGHSMLLQQKSSGHMVEVLDLVRLFNLHEDQVRVRVHYGEEAQEPEALPKDDLAFPSGEDLPRCWTDPNYRDDDIRR
jgi:hypothetical protein